MITVTKINQQKILLNIDLIESITSSPDTIIQLVNGKNIIVLDTPEEIKQKIIEFRRQIGRLSNQQKSNSDI
jgi:flagellar protein FlbD